MNKKEVSIQVYTATTTCKRSAFLGEAEVKSLKIYLIIIE